MAGFSLPTSEASSRRNSAHARCARGQDEACHHTASRGWESSYVCWMDSCPVTFGHPSGLTHMSKRITICCLLWLLSGCQIDAPLVATQHPNELSSADSSHVAVDDSPEYDGKPLPEKAMQHPSVEQLLACRKVEIFVKGRFSEEIDYHGKTMKSGTARVSWQVADLGPDLAREIHTKDALKENKESIKIEILDIGFRTRASYSLYRSSEDANGGYYENEAKEFYLPDLRFMREDSVKYIYRSLGDSARTSVRSRHEFQSRAIWWEEVLQPDSSLTTGEVIFYK